MKPSDDVQLKSEIDAISSRIDDILDTVKKYYPINETASDPIAAEQDADTEQLALSICQHNKSPEQEA